MELFIVEILISFLSVRYVELLISNTYLVDYVDAILRDERISMNDVVIMNFMEIYFPKVCVTKTKCTSIFLIYFPIFRLHLEYKLVA